MNFIKINDVVSMLLANGVVEIDEKENLEMFLTDLDVSIDGKSDDGFFKNQIQNGLNITFSHQNFFDESKILQANQLLQSYVNINDDDNDSFFTLALKFAISLFLPFACTGGEEMHECVQLSCGSCAKCYWELTGDGEETEEACYCPPNECSWYVDSKGNALCQKRPDLNYNNKYDNYNSSGYHYAPHSILPLQQ